MTKQQLLTIVGNQIACEMNCSPEDFSAQNTKVTRFCDPPTRRAFSRDTTQFDLMSFGNAAVLCATEDLFPYLDAKISGLSREETFAQWFVPSGAVYFLPDPQTGAPAPPAPTGLITEFFDQKEIPYLFKFSGFRNAIQYDSGAARPDVLALAAFENQSMVGCAGASADCKTMWQIGVDIQPDYRGKGLAAFLVCKLSDAILNQGKIPYYGTSFSNLPSQKTALRCGFFPAWVHSYRKGKEGLDALLSYTKKPNASR